MDQTQATTPKQSFLIVDDEPFIRAEIADLVHDLGHEAWEASSTAEALALLEKSAAAFTALVTDINMPGTRNGVVLANHVRFLWPHIRIVVVSAGRKPYFGQLPDDTPFITKPWDPEHLAWVLGH